jgi:hypothetical protein
MPSMDVHELEAEVQALRARVQELQDRWEIAELKARYFRIVDEKDWDAWRELFTDDATFDLGDGRLIEGADAFVDGVHGMLDGAPGRAVSVHRGHLPELTIDGPTEAHGRWGLADYIEWPSDPETGERRGYRATATSSRPTARWTASGRSRPGAWSTSAWTRCRGSRCPTGSSAGRRPSGRTSTSTR